eukprot:9503169-Pyramimonas_sp.AAC.1
MRVTENMPRPRVKIRSLVRTDEARGERAEVDMLLDRRRAPRVLERQARARGKFGAWPRTEIELTRDAGTSDITKE